MIVNRWFNVVMVWFCYLYALFFRRIPHLPTPYSLSIEPTNHCNLQCLECPSGSGMLKRDKGMMEFRMFKRIIDEVCKKIVSLTLYFQGEPLLNRDFTKMVSYAKSAGLWVETSTNAHNIDNELAVQIIESGLDKIIVSLDGIDQESYERYRCGGDFNSVIRGIEALVKAKRNRKLERSMLGRLLKNKPTIVLQFLVFRYNEHQIDDVRKLGKRIGVDRVDLKSAQIYSDKNASFLLTSIDKYSRYSVVDNGIKLKNKSKSICRRMFTNAVITWDGLVAPCCYDKDAEHCIGDIREDYYIDIMKEDRRRQFLSRVIENRDGMRICCNCNE